MLIYPLQNRFVNRRKEFSKNIFILFTYSELAGLNS